MIPNNIYLYVYDVISKTSRSICRKGFLSLKSLSSRWSKSIYYLKKGNKQQNFSARLTIEIIYLLC